MTVTWTIARLERVGANRMTGKGILGLLLWLVVAGNLACAAETVPASRPQIQLSYAPLVKATAPAVVNVYVTQRVKEFRSPFGDDPFFREFFGIPTERMQNSLGSGVIVRSDGLIVTNNHVVKSSGDADIRVALADKREMPARIILRDEKLDLAVLRIEGHGATFPHLDFDNSDQIEVGDLVLAIGNPFGIGQTVTSGIVSALARGGAEVNDQQYFIQTDAAINPGNSGGALIDMSGKLMGINTAIVTRSGGSQGIGFAIPANLVKVFVDSAISGKKIKKPWLGARLEPVTRDVAQALKLEKVAGALVADVDPEGPAAKAGLAAKDIIVGLDDNPVDDLGALTYRLDTRGVGGSAKLRVLRDGQPQTLDLGLEEAPKPAAVALSGAHPFDGAEVAQLSVGIADQLGLGRDVSGVVVVNLQTGSIAQGLGFHPGDVVIRINRTKIRNLDDLQRILKTPQRLWHLDIKRGDQVYQMTVNG